MNQLTTNNKGFALIVSLSLMAFIFLLIVGISSMSMVEQKTMVARQDVVLARKNAMIGVKVAMSKLQKYAGPDQRVTTRADILEEYSGGFKFDKNSVLNPYYTLVWDVSGSEGNKPGEEAEHDVTIKPVALVSGNDNGNDPIDLQSNLRNDKDAVWIVGRDERDGRGGDSFKRYEHELVDVIVKRETISSGNERNAHYAWWIGDEGIKARINLKESEEQEDHYTWTTPQRHGIQTIEGFGDLDSKGLSRVFTFKSLRLLDGGRDLKWDDMAETYHDLTAYSKGLLVDVKNGQLKKDLTYALDENNSAPADMADGDFIIEEWNAKKNESLLNIQYAQWGILRDYYNLKTNESKPAQGRPHMYGDDSYGVGLNPIITRVHQGWYVDKDPATRMAVIYHMPAVSLWNPYNVDLQCGEMNLVVNLVGHRNGGPNAAAMDFSINGRDADIMNTVYTLEPFTIPAGKSLIFSPRGDTPANYDKFEEISDGQYADGENILAPGWRSGSALIQESELKLGGNKNITLKLSATYPRLHVSLHYVDDRKGRRLKERAVFLSFLTATDAHSQGFKIDTSLRYKLNPLPGFQPAKLLFSSFMAFSDASHDFSNSQKRQIQWAGNFNPRACVPNRINPVYQLDKTAIFGAPSYAGGYREEDDAARFYEVETENGDHGFVGISPFRGATEASLFDIQKKDTRLTSLAQLGHAQITGIDNEHGHDQGRFLNEVMDESLGSASDSYAPAYAIGSALAPPFLPLSETFNLTRGSAGRIWERMPSWDYSYLLNDALFDKYFFSTVPQDGKWDKTKPLPNGLLEAYGNASEIDANLKDFDKVAGNLMLNGGFNVNSTSVNAWAAFLASMRGAEVRSKSGTEDSGERSPFVRMTEPLTGPIDDSDVYSDSEEVATGYRLLSDAQIFDLAERVVEQVKLRGPFPSMSAFVNRRLEGKKGIYKTDILSSSVGNPHEMYLGNLTVEKYIALKGALEGALENAEANEGFFDNEEFLAIEDKNSTGLAGSVSAHAPGYLSQIDLLSRLGAAMTVRSDTFVIRSYGDTVDPVTGIVGSEARVEVVVQRYPEFTDTRNKSWDEVGSLSTENQKWGRKFRVVSLRWLDDDDV